MQRHLTLSSVLLFSGVVAAQPTLTFATNAPQVGTTYTLHYGPYVSEGSPGADQIWDLSGLTTDSSDVLTLVDPATTTNGSSFPTATAAETGAEAIMYWRAATDGMYLVGSDAADLVIPYTDEGLYLPFPATYLDTWSDDVAAQFTVETVDVWRTGTITGEVDGYGTLLMPGFSATDVLRVHWHEESTDSTDLFNVESMYDSYLFFVVGQDYPIAQLVHTESTIFGNTIVTEHAQWIDEISTGVSAIGRELPELAVFPVPAQGSVSVVLPAGLAPGSIMAITDAQGRTVVRRQMTQRDGLAQVDISSLPAGVYRLTLTDARGVRSASIMVE